MGQTVKQTTRDAVEGLPTDQRLSQAGQDYAIGGDERSGKRYVMRDTPLDRALRKNVLTGAEHSALQKYRHHWYHAGQSPSISSVDLNRIFSPEPGGVAGMPKTEGQVFHRQRWREAQECLGLRLSVVADHLVCQEESLEQCGTRLGWVSKPQAIAGATEMLREAGFRLSKLWRIG